MALLDVTQDEAMDIALAAGARYQLAKIILVHKERLMKLMKHVKLDKEKHMESMKKQEQTEPERAEAERVEAEVVYSPMVAEPQEYQYNADAFEARGVDEVKQEAAHKEAPKVREDKAR